MNKKKLSWLNNFINKALSKEKKFNKMKHQTMFQVLTYHCLSKCKFIKQSMKQQKINWLNQNSNFENKSTNQRFHIMHFDTDFKKLLIKLMSWVTFQRKTLNSNQNKINFRQRSSKCKALIENFHKFWDNRKLFLLIYKKAETQVEIHL